MSWTFTGILSADEIGKRMVEIAGVLLIAGLITPPDLFSQIVVGIPAYILYKILYWFLTKFSNKESKGDSNVSFD